MHVGLTLQLLQFPSSTICDRHKKSTIRCYIDIYFGKLVYKCNLWHNVFKYQLKICPNIQVLITVLTPIMNSFLQWLHGAVVTAQFCSLWFNYCNLSNSRPYIHLHLHVKYLYLASLFQTDLTLWLYIWQKQLLNHLQFKCSQFIKKECLYTCFHSKYMFLHNQTGKEQLCDAFNRVYFFYNWIEHVSIFISNLRKKTNFIPIPK